MLSRYRNFQKLGGGGMGVVYRADDTTLQRPVALKFLTVATSGEAEQRARLLREARSAAALEHPSICTIHDVGEVQPGEEESLGDGNRLAAGTPFIAMELVEGHTLEAALKARASLPLDDLLKIAARIAEGLASAHAKGIVHRDLKPGNVMVAPDGRIKILDFGLAKPLEPAGESDAIGTVAETISAELTRQGTVLGTVAYMSPEQAMGKAVDSRSDVFSFGIMLYEMAAGRRPFQGETSTSTLAKILEAEPEPLEESRADLPIELLRIVRRCLRKKPDDRYNDTRDLVVALKDLRQETTSGKTRVVESAPRRSRAALFGGLAVLVIIVAAVALFIGMRQGLFSQDAGRKVIDSIAVLPFENVGQDPDAEYLSEGITESLINNLSPIPELKVMARSTVFRYKDSDQTPQEIGRALEVGVVLAGRVDQRDDRLVISVELIDVGNGTQLWGERFNRELADIFAIERAISRGIGENLRLQLTGADEERLARQHTENSEAYQLYLRGRYHWYKRTEEDARKALEYFERSRDLDPEFALAYTGIADSYLTGGGELLGIPQEEAIAKGQAAALRALELNDSLAEAHNSLASAKMLQHDWKGSERESRRAIELNPGYAQARMWYSEHLMWLGRHEEAIAEARRALELDPFSPYMNAMLGLRYLFARRYGEAEKQCLQALELDEQSPGAVWCIAHAKLLGGSLEGLLPWLERMEAEDSTEEELPALRSAYEAEGLPGYWRWKLAHLMEQDPDKSVIRHTEVATCLAQLGRKAEALDLLEQAYNEGRYLHSLKENPFLDPLRSEPRFQQLIRQIFPDS